MRFSKMHGIGNDYVYVNGFTERMDDPASVAVKISDRHFGIGSDGLILILPSQTADFRMRMFNADGSEGKMCGNGIRCVGNTYDMGLTDKTEVTVETLAGIRKLVLYRERTKLKRFGCGWVSCVFLTGTISPTSEKRFPVTLAVHDSDFYCVSMGNPHAVTIVDDTDSFPVEYYGTEVQKNSIFPESVNVEFVQLVSRTSIKMRVYERGSGETLACGTGACASAAALMRLGMIDRKAEVRLLGGTLEVDWQEDGLYMTGPAAHVFDGEIDI